MVPDPMAVRLRELRRSGFERAVTQQEIAAALGVSGPLISSWENGNATPPDGRLADYARFFATARTLERGRPHLVDPADLDERERERYEQLLAELRELRPAAGAEGLTTLPPRAGMWHFPDRSTITIVCARLPAHARASESYTSPDSPDYVELYSYADLDALMELFGHIRAANPEVPVERRLADSLRTEDLTTHLVLLGGVDWNDMTRRAMQALSLPVSQDLRATDDPDDPDVGSFRAEGEDGSTQVYRSVLEGSRLVEDVAQFCRGPSPFNRKRTITICNGNFGRGTYAAVRALTDPRFRDRNREYLEGRYGPNSLYSILARVNIINGEVVTPDWTLPGTILHEWSRDS